MAMKAGSEMARRSRSSNCRAWATSGVNFRHGRAGLGGIRWIGVLGVDVTTNPAAGCGKRRHALPPAPLEIEARGLQKIVEFRPVRERGGLGIPPRNPLPNLLNRQLRGTEQRPLGEFQRPQRIHRPWVNLLAAGYGCVLAGQDGDPE